MNDLLQDWWHTIAGSGLVASALGWLGVNTLKRIDKLETGKADRDELTRIMQLIEKRDDDARQSRRELHQKIDTFTATQHEVNRDLTKLIGRLDNNH